MRYDVDRVGPIFAGDPAQAGDLPRQVRDAGPAGDR